MAGPPPRIPNWRAPHPFNGVQSVVHGDNDFRVNLGTEARASRVVATLERLTNLGATNNFTTDNLLNETQLWEALNAFNLHTEGALQVPWCWVNQHVLEIPNQTSLPPGFTWDNWQNQNRIDTHTRDLLREFDHAWVPTTARPNRVRGTDPMYRFIVFMHRHDHEGGVRPHLNRVYSATIYDRENQTANWFDLWHRDNPDQRWQDVVAYWANIPNTWPVEVTGNLPMRLNRSVYSSLADVEAVAYHRIPPAYTQYAMINIILFYMRNSNENGGTPANPILMVPTDMLDKITGLNIFYLAKLIVVLFQAIRLSGQRNEFVGNLQITYHQIAAFFWVRNASLQHKVRQWLRDAYYGTDQEWLIDAITG
ncbi:hypothetical protein F5Y13DRAFT_195455 [Hypoxylon sp. FL1857]|nr:hypothetical protein F5Y13DRAFT_195455 [Hypoxylon sp. FL1857]